MIKLFFCEGLITYSSKINILHYGLVNLVSFQLF